MTDCHTHLKEGIENLNEKTVSLDDPKDLREFQIEVSVGTDLMVMITAADPCQLLELATRIVTTLKQEFGLNPKVKVMP